MADESTGSHHHPLQPELVPAATQEGDDENDDNDSALGSAESVSSSTASVTSSVLNYRTIHGRTYHSDKYNVEYFTPNDDRQLESIDLTHHYLSVLLDNKLYLAPIKKDIQKVLDVGTGTGIWAIDFADEFPGAEVIGTDLSPIQPTWVPPNCKFEIEDATEQWSWPDNTFDFVHIRYLMGAISDWDFLYRQAYRCCKPGGWFETCEVDALPISDDGTVEGVYAAERWNEMYREAGKKTGRPFTVVEDNLQADAVKNAGFVGYTQVDYKVPVGSWPADKKLREVGEFVKLTILNDIEGYTQYLWHTVLEWPQDEYQVFLMSFRKYLKDRSIHSYMRLRHVYGRKPKENEAPAS